MENSSKLARALYTNKPESKSELYFQKGEILTVIEFDYEEQKGWWLCTLRGERVSGERALCIMHSIVNCNCSIPERLDSMKQKM
jgi:hypothetical protein